ncbi:coiled-coil domain-containing protein 172 isoform X4 [Callorhinchus milii]|uniref:coiled-coil domain-containing protein 172 isoform X4 n=1 Tax=Callorhinchus milii TaxID=7868 RepID=UPI000457412F|nr:coiled-coil domain-containing protein 172 isoform X4 [Callorhinchus milii]|eukprot:gi/632981006/ref/XP_007907352.1/ PREDICTED: coiled-coil domain-containing protein 172 isoform X2 [Callorhinchus milii]
MSLDNLFEEILATEQKVLERRQFLQGVKSEMIRCNEKLREVKEELCANRMTLELKKQEFSEKKFHLELLKKREESLKKQREEITRENNIYLEALKEKKRKYTEEREKFVSEISEFNTEYDLLSNRAIVIEIKAKTKICDLEAEARCLESDFKDELAAAFSHTQTQEAEKAQICQKPQTDHEFLRLKNELEMHREDDLESVCEALRTEIQFLQLKLSQGKQQQMNNSRVTSQWGTSELSNEQEHGLSQQP